MIIPIKNPIVQAVLLARFLALFKSFPQIPTLARDCALFDQAVNLLGYYASFGRNHGFSRKISDPIFFTKNIII
jgi:hypothetical protein